MEQKLEHLREKTQWVLVPSLNELGTVKVMPTFKMSDHLISGIKGHGKIQNITLATNPMRLSFRGKEIVFSRYDYFKRVKRSMIQKISERFPPEGPDSRNIVNTVLKQASLMPLSPIIQPLLWSHADSLHLLPEPDILVLADEC